MHTTLARAVAVAAIAGCTVANAATIIDIESTNPFGTTLSLAAGTYSLSYIGQADGGRYNAWTAWSPGGDCGGGPGSCPNGFINELRIEGVTADPLYIGDHFNPIWPTAAEALQAAKTQHSPFTLTLTDPTTVRFLVGEGAQFAQTGVDGPAWRDNSGGLSLTISAVPEPGPAALMFAGLLLLGGTVRRRQR